MTAFTLRLDDHVARKLDHLCRERGYKKTGLVKALIRDFLKKATPQNSRNKQSKSLSSLVGIVNLGGDAMKDDGGYFE